jgi:hypothetical protein
MGGDGGGLVRGDVGGLLEGLVGGDVGGPVGGLVGSPVGGDVGGLVGGDVGGLVGGLVGGDVGDPVGGLVGLSVPAEETRLSICLAHHSGLLSLTILGKVASRSTMNKTVAASRMKSEPVSDLSWASSPPKRMVKIPRMRSAAPAATTFQ